jgi:hypothetical protein
MVVGVALVGRVGNVDKSDLEVFLGYASLCAGGTG